MVQPVHDQNLMAPGQHQGSGNEPRYETPVSISSQTNELLQLQHIRQIINSQHTKQNKGVHGACLPRETSHSTHAGTVFGVKKAERWQGDPFNVHMSKYAGASYHHKKHSLMPSPPLPVRLLVDVHKEVAKKAGTTAK